MSDANAQLAYGRGRRRRRWPWLALAGVAAVGLVLSLNAGRARALRAQLAFLYWQHACAAWSLPPDQVVYEDDPARAAALLRSGKQYAPVYLGGDDVEGFQLPTGYAPPECVTRIWGDHPFPTVVFVHQLRGPNGPRLALIDAHVEEVTSARSGRTIVLWGRSRTPGWSAGALGWESRSAIFIPLKHSDILRLFAGQCDPDDSRAFRIPYELNGTPGVITGRLLDSGKFQWRITGGNLRHER